ncbi:MAG: phospholipase D family protein [Planctomycetes bacterium]|nr:phospholipase D family protein [Planctomycetota bacterium]
MRFLSTPTELSDAFRECIEFAVRIDGAVAWAGVGFEGYDLLWQHRHKIRRLLVGIHFFQTHPDFVEEFLNLDTVRFVLRSDGIFHPKVFCFHYRNDSWKCIVGSANLTRSAFETNDEAAVLIESNDSGAFRLKESLQEAIDKWWRRGAKLTPRQAAWYREEWKRARPAVSKLQKIRCVDWPDGRQIRPLDFSLLVKNKGPLNLSWDEFLARVKNEPVYPINDGGTPLSERLHVLAWCREAFGRSEKFGDLKQGERRRIAGCAKKSIEDKRFLWFGSCGSGMLAKAINENEGRISRALDLIPSRGPVSRRQCEDFAVLMRLAFPEYVQMASATRLLAMKRSDLFVCVNNMNTYWICQLLGARLKLLQRPRTWWDPYWDEIIERIQASAWWNSDRPKHDETAMAVWDGRAALLDALCYAGTND